MKKEEFINQLREMLPDEIYTCKRETSMDYVLVDGGKAAQNTGIVNLVLSIKGFYYKDYNEGV